MLPLMVDIWQQTLNWQPDEKQQRQFQQLYELIVAGNRQLNLTRITEPSDFWEKHLWDSLRGIAPFLLNPLPITNYPLPITNPQVIDIGTGAGFPGVPCAIALPHCQVTLLDSTRKKIAFLDTLLAQLGLSNATTLLGRSEQINQQSQYRKNYDLALIRAVGSASVCAEYALPFLKNGGLAILYRGHWTDEETADLQPVLERLGGKLESIEAFSTPLSQSVRHCLYLRKN
ncbi:MAG TPA: 16S rRNA (guanine(527)-N(7))-methyltransferase RsmG [Cyanobacteria bacterium UBA11369]|nr:16S rRNA (guanine(527)-N(7))-methyltransferase RsmG [Cyanobacteria bacterium UBA11371]HBE35279.1 16S rRNA (guanine(527)-N(7))-methyltransferase RsmG [Cyanobacteria bacterium UBA11368]HBE48461.1 16S rRNA (guanine(527)-N(7))-methyltransferase RsmG [Cyanobacteria bacterium UBA11369]